MHPTERAISHADIGACNELSKAYWRSCTCTTLVHSGPCLLAPNGTIDEKIVTVDWDGPDDLENPRNWSFGRKWGTTLLVSAFAFMGPVSSSMIAPASKQLEERFDMHNTVLLAMTTSVYVLAYAFGPLFLSPLSEVYGRSPVIQLANLWYLVWNTACGLARNMNELIVLRFMAGLGGSAPLAINGALIGDLFEPEDRGKAMSIYSLAPLLGPAIGPIAGAWIAEKSTWRWVFWSTSLAAAAIQAAGALYLKETYAPVLLGHKATAIRKAMDQEKVTHVVIRTSVETADKHWKAILRKGLVRPYMLLTHEPIVQLLGLYMAFIFAHLYLFVTTMPAIFQDVYHQRVGIAGLHYLALGLGLTVGSQFSAIFMDRIYLWLKSRNGGVGKPEFRLPIIVPGTILIPIGVLITGWSAQNRVFWLVPDIGIAIVGAGIVLAFQNIQTYVIDSFTLHAASALAAVSFLRSLVCFGLPLIAPAMYNTLGYGKGDTLLAVVAIAGCPAPWLFWFYGERIRNASRFAPKANS